MTDVLGRILLFSDLQLGRPYPGMPTGFGAERRAAQREALVEVLKIARESKVDVIACAGNLFDRRTVMPELMDWLLAALRSVEVPVLIAPGNLDHVGPLGGYDCYEWPDHVKVFTSSEFEPVTVMENLTIWGAAHTEAHRSESLVSDVDIDHPGVNLALCHAIPVDELEADTVLDLFAEFDEEVPDAGFDHALIGHDWRPIADRTTYSGAPVQHDFWDQSHPGCLVLEVQSDGSVEETFHRSATPPMNFFGVPLKGAGSSDEAMALIRDRVASAVASSGWTRVDLLGPVSADVSLERDMIAGLFRDPDRVIISDRTRVSVAEAPGDGSIRARFISELLVPDAGPFSQPEHALLIGLRALDGYEQLERLR